MKKILLLSTIFIFCFNFAYSQNWEILDYPAQEGLTGISALSPDTFFLVTDNGKVIRTIDGGKNWQFNKLTLGTALEDVIFLDKDYGYTCGDKCIVLMTTNGGRNWTPLNPSEDTTNYLFDLAMVNDSIGLAVAIDKDSTHKYSGFVYITSDYGVNWERINPDGIGFSECLYDNGIYYLVSFGKIHISEDLGRSWKSIKTHDGNPGRCITKYNKNLIIAGIRGLILYSNDEGQTWYKTAQEFEDVNFFAAAMYDQNRGFIAGSDGSLFQTYNGGKAWEKMSLPAAFNILDITVTGNYLIVAGSGGNVLKLKLI